MTEHNGSDVMLGHILGQLLASNSEQIRLAQVNIHVLEKMQDDLQELPHRLAQVMKTEMRTPHMSLFRRLDIGFKELILIGGAVLAGLAGLTEGQSIKEAVSSTVNQITGAGP